MTGICRAAILSVSTGIYGNLEKFDNLSTSILENGSATARYCKQSAEINDRLNQQVGFFKV